MDTSNEQNNKEQNEKNNNVNNDEEKDMDEDSSSIESIFKDDPPKNEEEDKKEEKEEKSDTNILNIFMGKKKKKELTPEQKEERIKKSIERYCKRNDRMLELIEKVNKGEATNRNIKEMMRLLAIDLSDTKKLINKKALISRKKEELFEKLFNLTFLEYQRFWALLTNGKYKKGNAQLINSGNIGKAKTILKEILENRKKKENKDNENNDKNNNRTVREIIDHRKNLESANEDLDDVFLRYDPDISSDEDSLESSVDESSSDNDNDNDEISKKDGKDKEKEEEEKKKKEEMERELKEKERELKEKEEKMKKFMDKEDEIDIFN